MNPSPTHVEASTTMKVTYERRTALFGILSWWTEVKADAFLDDIHILAEKIPDRVLVNGVEYRPLTPTP